MSERDVTASDGGRSAVRGASATSKQLRYLFGIAAVGDYNAHMSMSQASAASPAVSYAPELRIIVFALFFIFGGITSLNDVIIPKLKGLFTLNYAQVMLVQSAFFAAYFVISCRRPPCCAVSATCARPPLGYC